MCVGPSVRRKTEKFLKAGGCVGKRWIEQDLRFMSRKGGKKQKSGRGVSVQTGELLPVSWEKETLPAAGLQGVVEVCGQGHMAGEEFQGAWHREDARYLGTPSWPSCVTSQCDTFWAYAQTWPNHSWASTGQSMGQDVARERTL